ncbi:efflux RND transporter periplasmic adaptor subunit [Legionella fallonii]|uniref:RND family efflux transporter n=1 Tax=Legionella fallonii LLAP-10 TaxID=1212491 RepID=A0A098G9R4_9GAMM|nr:efflux RND transporter periplasmic adaptor subunit [Legionella fallonii]CEG58727.1 RND family efflux transporter [Legionella fallonii LLAP-10]
MKFRARISAQYQKLSTKQQSIAILLMALVCLLFITILFQYYWYSNREQSDVPPMMIRQGNQIKIPEHSPLRAQLTIKPVSVSNLPHIVSLPGVIEIDPTHNVNLLPPLTGRLTKLNANIGDLVKKDQILAEISSPDLAQASSDNDKAIATLQLATEALKRAKAVNHAGGSAVKDVQIAESNYIQSQAEAKRTANRLHTLSNNGFSSLTIRAPRDGKITALNYGLGSYITDPTAILMSLVDLSTIWVTANVPENIIGSIAPNQPVEISLSAYPNQYLQGKITFVNALVDPDTHRNKTRIALPNPDGKLQPNMYATIKVTVPQPKSILIPISALFMNNDTTSVYVETAPWTFERKIVQLGTEDGNTIRVESGLKDSDRIVVNGGIFIND